MINLKSERILVQEYVLWGWILTIAAEEILELTGEEGSGNLATIIISFENIFLLTTLQDTFRNSPTKWI